MKDNNTEIENNEENDDYVVKKNKKLNIFAIVFCLIISLTIWLYVMNAENYQYEKTFTGIPVRIDGVTVLEKVQNMSIISGYNSFINVTVKGNKSVIDKLSSSDFTASLDVGELSEPNSYDIVVKLEPIQDVIFIDIPDVVIKVGKNITIEQAVEISPIYSIAKIYNIEYYSVTKTVEITGPEEVIDTVKYAIVKYDLGTVKTSLNFRSYIELYDENHKLIDNPYITKSINEIDVNVDVTTNSVVPIEAEFSANDTDTYKYSIQFNPITLNLVGDPLYVEKVTSIIINLGDISGKESGQIELTELNAPENTVFENDEDLIIKYTIEKTLITP